MYTFEEFFVYIMVTSKCVHFANSEVPDEMLHDAAFHQGLHYLLIKAIFTEVITISFGNQNL